MKQVTRESVSAGGRFDEGSFRNNENTVQDPREQTFSFLFLFRLQDKKGKRSRQQEVMNSAKPFASSDANKKTFALIGADQYVRKPRQHPTQRRSCQNIVCLLIFLGKYCSRETKKKKFLDQQQGVIIRCVVGDRAKLAT